MFILYISNKNYSSWSMRPWVLLREQGIPFEERLIPFGDTTDPKGFHAFSPTGKVPCLVDGDITVWDSLSIVEYVAERHPGVWPEDPVAHAWARSAAAEMHSGFQTLRNVCTMNCGIRVRLPTRPQALEMDLQRIETLWREGLQRFGGPFLAGERFTAVDAFYAPVAFRLQTYRLRLNEAADNYAERLRSLPSLVEWYEAALKERWRDEAHEEEARLAGDWIEDLRAKG